MKLVQRGPETMRLTVQPGTGLQFASRNGSVYTLRGYNSWVKITVTASNCTGIQVMDRENGYNCEFRPSDKGVASYAGVFYASAYGPTVYVSDPTDDTEVIMHVVPIPPPYFVRFLRCLRGGSHGAKARWFSRPGGVHPHRKRQRMVFGVGFSRPVGGIVERECSPRPRPLQGGNFRAQLHHDLQCVPLVIDRRPNNPHRLPGDARIRHTNLRERQRQHHHHQVGLASVGGGA